MRKDATAPLQQLLRTSIEAMAVNGDATAPPFSHGDAYRLSQISKLRTSISTIAAANRLNFGQRRLQLANLTHLPSIRERCAAHVVEDLFLTMVVFAKTQTMVQPTAKEMDVLGTQIIPIIVA